MKLGVVEDPATVGGHEWFCDPPWSECMKCRKCGARSTYATIGSPKYSAELPCCGSAAVGRIQGFPPVSSFSEEQS